MIAARISAPVVSPKRMRRFIQIVSREIIITDAASPQYHIVEQHLVDDAAMAF
jgi:hypothetical protein